MVNKTKSHFSVKGFFNNRKLRTKIVLGFLIPIVFLLSLSTTNYLNTGALIETARWVNHTQEVMTRGQLLDSLILEMESSQRGYLITGKENFLEPYLEARNHWNAEINAGIQQVSDNPPQVKLLFDIDNLAQAWIAEVATPEITLRQNMSYIAPTNEEVSMAKITQLLETNQSKKRVKLIREQITKFIDVEKQLIVERNLAAEAAVNRSFHQTLIGSLIALVILIAVASYLIKSIMASLHKLSQATRKVANGDFSVNVPIDSQDEVGDLAQSFNKMTKKLSNLVEEINQSRNDLQRKTELLTNKNHEIEDFNEELINTQKELTIYAKKLEETSQCKSDFLATMSHEIRTPMNGVLGMLSLLENTALSYDQRKKLEMATTSASSLLTIINDILDFSKVDADKIELEVLDFDLQNLIANFSETVAINAQEKGLEFILDTNNLNTQHVMGDSGRLLQILTNIVGNAIKFTESGEIIIKVCDKQVNNDQVQLIFDIIDTGIGISLEKQATIFDKFKQADASTTRQYGGTGLGLAIAKRLCELMEGTISVRTPSQGGTCFHFELFLGVNKDQPALKQLKRTDNCGSICIIDPNQSNRRMLSVMLNQNWGISTLTYANAVEALHALAITQENISLFLVNHTLPDMTISDLSKQLDLSIQKNPTLCNNTLNKSHKVIMTPMAQLQDATSLISQGYDLHVSKPVTHEDIKNCLSHFHLFKDEANQTTGSDPLVQVATENTAIELVANTENWPDDIRVLLVEDTFINQEVIKGILSIYPINLDVAENGAEAIKLLNEATDHPYSLILMDCQMPIMDGYSATRNIRQGAAGYNYKNLPIIALTANAMEGDRQKCLDAGMSDYLSKPIDTKLLDLALKQWLLKPIAPLDNEVSHADSEAEVQSRTITR